MKTVMRTSLSFMTRPPSFEAAMLCKLVYHEA